MCLAYVIKDHAHKLSVKEKYHKLERNAIADTAKSDSILLFYVEVNIVLFGFFFPVVEGEVVEDDAGAGFEFFAEFAFESVHDRRHGVAGNDIVFR